MLPIDSAIKNSNRYPKIKVKPTIWVEEHLRTDIANGVYAPNSFLPPQRTLAESFGVTRRAVRIALEKLKEAGLIESSRGRGTRVLPRTERSARQKIAYIHSPVKSWIGLEPHHIHTGILHRLEQLNCDYTEVIISKDNILSGHGELSKIVTPAGLPEVLKNFSAFIFHEASPLVAGIITDMVNNNAPVVVANLEIELNVSATLVDHKDVSMRAVETLTSFGHKRIAYIGVKPDYVFYGLALEGFKAGMRTAGLKIDKSLIAICERSNMFDAYKATLQLIQHPDPPTAIVAARDSIAAGICQAIRETGLEVGRDISVIGFDDVSWDGPTPFMTTFHEPCTEMGTIAVDMLMVRIQNPELPLEKKVLDTPLILRRSVGPVIF